jgi:hypothetical protein
MRSKFCDQCVQVVLWLLLSLASHASFAQEMTTWVSGVGDDANPCRRTAHCTTFSGALLNTADLGEINALDSGEFDVVDFNDPTTATALIINKSVSIDGGSLNIATMGPLNTINLDAITIDAGPNAIVILRNLVLNGLSGSNRNGIRIISARSVRIENVKINSYWQSCIDIQASTPINVDLMNVDLTACGNGLSVAGTNANVTINESSLTNNSNGIVGSGAGVVVRYADLTQDNTNEITATSGASISSAYFSFGEFFTIDTAQIPTLSEWAMILMASLMGMIAFVRLRRNEVC